MWQACHHWRLELSPRQPSVESVAFDTRTRIGATRFGLPVVKGMTRFGQLWSMLGYSKRTSPVTAVKLPVQARTSTSALWAAVRTFLIPLTLTLKTRFSFLPTVTASERRNEASGVNDDERSDVTEDPFHFGSVRNIRNLISNTRLWIRRQLEV